MAEITIVKPHDEGKSALEVTVNGEKWSLIRGETADVPDYIAEEVRRSLAQRESLSLSDRDEREGEPEGSGGGGGGESSNVETATIVFTVTGENGVATVTSGEIPDWCTPANSDNIYGHVIINGETEHGTYENCDGKIIGVRVFANSPYEIWALEGIYGESSGRSIPFVTLDSALMLMGEEINNLPFLSGSLTFNLIYMPEE